MLKIRKRLARIVTNLAVAASTSWLSVSLIKWQLSGPTFDIDESACLVVHEAPHKWLVQSYMALSVLFSASHLAYILQRKYQGMLEADPGHYLIIRRSGLADIASIATLFALNIISPKSFYCNRMDHYQETVHALGVLSVSGQSIEWLRSLCTIKPEGLLEVPDYQHQQIISSQTQYHGLEIHSPRPQ